MDQIHIPSGINYECTGCGNCCLQWPVPLTADDVERISKLDLLVPVDTSSGSGKGTLFRGLRTNDPKLAVFTHTLEKRGDGKCAFLTVDNRCQLHQDHGASMKPAMCQLFPYTFTPTPSGVYASVSFASTGALLNSGRALSDQADLLQDKWQLFSKLLPNLRPDWSRIQLVDGVPVDWATYLEIEAECLRLIDPSISSKPIMQRLADCSSHIRKQLSAGIDLESTPKLEARPKIVDQLLLKHLLKFYFPEHVFTDHTSDLDATAILTEITHAPDIVAIEYSGQRFRFPQLISTDLGQLDADTENLLYRFAYCRIFSKLYFGFGFSNLSLLTGVHHLIVLIALIRMQIKLSQLIEGKKVISFLEIVELVRCLERRLTLAELSAKTAAVLEVLLTSPSRMERIVTIAS